MGIDFAQLEFFDTCHAVGGLKDPILGIGSLMIQESQEDIERFARENDYADLLKTKSVKSFFLARYGIQKYSDCDINGLADYYFWVFKSHPSKIPTHHFRKLLLL